MTGGLKFLTKGTHSAITENERLSSRRRAVTCTVYLSFYKSSQHKTTMKGPSKPSSETTSHRSGLSHRLKYVLYVYNVMFLSTPDVDAAWWVQAQWTSNRTSLTEIP